MEWIQIWLHMKFWHILCFWKGLKGEYSVLWKTAIMDQNELDVNIKRQNFTLKLPFPIIFSKKYIFKNLFFEREKPPTWNPPKFKNGLLD